MVHYAREVVMAAPAKVIDVEDDESSMLINEPPLPYDSSEMLAYRVRAEGLLRSLIDELPVLQKIKQGIAVQKMILSHFSRQY